MTPSIPSINESMLLEQYFEIIPFDIYVVDVNTYDLVYVNAKMREKLSEPFDQSQKCHQIIYDIPTPCIFCNIPKLIKENGQSNRTTHISEMYDESRELWLQVHEKVINWPDGRLVKYAIGVDISEIKDVQNRLAEAHARMTLMNRELQQQNKILEENIRLREDVDRMTRHDLKTPLTPIINYPRIIMDETPALSDNNIQMLQDISRAGVSMLNMINRTLDLFKLEQGTYELQATPCSILDILNTATADLHSITQSRAVQFELSVSSNSQSDEDFFLVKTELMLCYSLFSNLLKNAVEASPEGGRVLIIVAEEQDMIQVSIQNSGETPEEIRSTFFDKYVTARKGGTGLGTYSAKLITEAHGGKIELDASIPGQTTVLVILPRADAAEELPPENIDRQTAFISTSHEYANTSRIPEASTSAGQHNNRILIVEDYPINQKLILRYLDSSGYKADTADNGQQALELLEHNDYDLVLMDVEMPVMNGLEAARIIRGPAGAVHKHSRIPIIAMTAHSDDMFREKCIEAGMDDYLSKPVQMQELLAIVKKWTGSFARKSDLEYLSSQKIKVHALDESNPPMDHEVALRQMDNDEDFLQQVVDSFVVDAERRLSMLEDALTAEDVDAVILHAHTLKGGSANIAARYLSEAAGELEEAGQSRTLEKGMEKFEKVRKEFNRLKEYLN